MNDVLKELLRAGVTEVTFTKANGEIRKMNCTLNPELVPPTEPPSDDARTRKSNPDVQVVWDVDKQAWRSFRLDSIIEFGL
jgi:hypothetical protein